MQSKKRAKPVKFGSKPQPSKSVANLPAGRQGDKPPSIHPEEADKEEKSENSVEIILETESEDVQISAPASKNQRSEQKDESSGTSPTEAPPVGEEEDNKTAQNKEQDQLIPITQDSETIADTPSMPEPMKGENKEEQGVELSDKEQSAVPTGTEQATDSTHATLGGDTYIVEKEVKKNMLGYFWLIAIISFVVGLLSMAALNFFLPNAGMSAGIFFFSRPITATPSPKPTGKPTPTAKVLNLAEYSIEILNGSGITGEATKLKESLVNDGFKVDAVGNADSSDYTDTIIFAKEEVSSEYLTKLKEKLNETYTLDADIKPPTGATSEADIIITIGSNTAVN